MRVFIVEGIACVGEDRWIAGVFSDRESARARARALLSGRAHNSTVGEWTVDGACGETEFFGEDA